MNVPARVPRHLRRLAVGPVIGLALLVNAGPLAAAPMYQWQHPSTGTQQLSGTPPAWYRGVTDGPRVLVFENGRLIDDTAIVVSEAQRVYLRQLAFGQPGPRRAEAAGPAPSATPDPATLEAPSMAAIEAVQNSAEESIDRLKSILEVWDRLRKAEAQAIIDGPIEDADTESP